MAKTRLQHFTVAPSTAVREVACVVLTAGVKTIIDRGGLSAVRSQVTFCWADGAALESANKATALPTKLIALATPEVAAKAAQHAKQKEPE